MRGLLPDLGEPFYPGKIMPEEMQMQRTTAFEVEMIQRQMQQEQIMKLQSMSLASQPMFSAELPAPPLPVPSRCAHCDALGGMEHDDFCPNLKRSVREILQGWVNKWLSDAITT